MFELAQGNLASVDDKGPGELDDILGAHPRLGEKKVDSALSRDEQARMRAAGTGSGSSTEEEEMLRRLNEEYEAVYPGLRYVVFVNGRSRSVIMDDMRMRIQRVDPKLEREQAIQAMCDIAADRAAKLLCEAPMDGQDIE
ncbi:MAG: member of Set1p complex, histone methyl transferase [Chaenotheca gracillima]|nr:MAG: member of Set1p complex, histone methyl transferase [Chaenotheca gracillima]